MILAALVLAAALAVTPSPTPSPPPDACTAGGHTSLLAALNRPTVGFSACTVSQGERVLEAGYQQSAGDTDLSQIGQGFLRFGVDPRLELDIVGPAYLLSPRAHAAGFADLGAGAKWSLSRGAHTASGIDLLLTFPSGAAAFTAGKPTQTLNFDYGSSFGKFGFATTLGLQHANGYGSALPSVVLTNQYNERTQWYAEAFAQTRIAPGGPSLFGQDAGVQYMLTPRLEFDVEIGHTNAGSVRSNYAGFGFGAAF